MLSEKDQSGLVHFTRPHHLPSNICKNLDDKGIIGTLFLVQLQLTETGIYVAINTEYIFMPGSFACLNGPRVEPSSVLLSTSRNWMSFFHI